MDLSELPRVTGTHLACNSAERAVMEEKMKSSIRCDSGSIRRQGNASKVAWIRDGLLTTGPALAIPMPGQSVGDGSG